MDGIGAFIMLVLIIVVNVIQAKAKKNRAANKDPLQANRAQQKTAPGVTRKARPNARAQQPLSMDMNPAEAQTPAGKASSPIAVMQTRMELRPAPQAGAAKAQPRTEMKPRVAQTITSTVSASPRDGSMTMPKPAPHTHEGKPAPCPAEAREKPRPRPSDLSPAQGEGASVVIPGLQMAFNQSTLLQGVIMSEILNRPRFGRGAR